MIGPYNHGSGCACRTCIEKASGAEDMRKYFGGRTGDSADSKYQPDIALCSAKAMEHGQKSSKHSDAMWESRREGSGKAPMPAEKMADHITASTFHNRAADHYNSAARAYAENRPKGAEEHLAAAKKFGKKGDDASEKAFA